MSSLTFMPGSLLPVDAEPHTFTMIGRLPAISRWQTVRVDRTVIRQGHSLKEVIAVGAIVEAAQHAAVLETDGRSCTGMDRFARAFRGVPYSRSQRDNRV